MAYDGYIKTAELTGIQDGDIALQVADALDGSIWTVVLDYRTDTYWLVEEQQVDVK